MFCWCRGLEVAPSIPIFDSPSSMYAFQSLLRDSSWASFSSLNMSHTSRHFLQLWAVSSRGRLPFWVNHLSSWVAVVCETHMGIVAWFSSLVSSKARVQSARALDLYISHGYYSSVGNNFT